MKKKIAKKIFNSGLNCSQTILSTYAADFDVDEKIAQSISCGFGAGMGQLQKTCGAVTGSFMVIGLYNGPKFGNNAVRKVETYKMIRAFSDQFLKKHETLDCRDLINCDLRTEEGQHYAKENNVFENICEKCVIVDCVGILDDLMSE